MVNPISGPQEPSSPQAPAPSSITGDAVSQAGAVQASGKATSSTKISSIADLKTKSPEFYQQLLQSIATKICYQMKDHQDQLKKIMREGRNNS